MEEQEGDLSWLQDFIDAKFYVPCECGKKNTTNFCCQCRSLPFCEECKNNTHQHHYHNVLRICKASHHTAICVLKIKKLLDVSDIQTYSFNGQRVVYVSQRQRNGKISNEKVSGKKCQVCGWSGLSSLLCSIQCKVIWKSKEEKIINSCIKYENSSTQKPLEEYYVAPPGSYRKRNRKGNPVCSPLM